MGKYYINEKRIIIHGTGGMCRKVERLLLEKGLYIDCYLDIRADAIKKFSGKNVYTIQDAVKKITQKDDYVVILTSKNVFEHNQIVNELVMGGFNHIIYKDYRVLQGELIDKEMESIDRAYEAILNQGMLPDEQIEDIVSAGMISIEDKMLIKKVNGDVIAYFPVALLFSNSGGNRWNRVHIASSYIPLDLYKAFKEGDKNTLRETVIKYIKYFASDGAELLKLNTGGNWAELVIAGRMQVFNEMQLLLWTKPQFFIDNCPMISGNSRDGFELITSGKNRVIFQIAYNHNIIPLRISQEEYECYLNHNVVIKIRKYIENNHIVKIDFPILHPYFYKFPTKYTNYFELWLMRISNIISHDIFNIFEKCEHERYSIALFGNDGGNAERYFAMLNFKIYNMGGTDCFGEMLNELFYFKRNSKNNSMERKVDYIVAFVTSKDQMKELCSEIKPYIFKELYIAGPEEVLYQYITKSDVENCKCLFEALWDWNYYVGLRVNFLEFNEWKWS